MEFNMESLVATLQVQTNRNEEEKRKNEIRERNARMMREALGTADV